MNKKRKSSIIDIETDKRIRIMKKTIIKIMIIFALLLCVITAAAALSSCGDSIKEDLPSESGSSLTPEVRAFMNIAPEEVKNLKEFDILYSDKYYVQIKTTYLLNDMRMKISRDKDKYDIFSETAKVYSHTIIKDGMSYSVFDEKKTYSVSEAKEQPNISFFDMKGSFTYTGVEDGAFNGQNANIYKFDVLLENNEHNILKFVIKEGRLLGVIAITNGFETKMEFEKVAKDIPEDAFSVPSDYELIESDEDS